MRTARRFVVGMNLRCRYWSRDVFFWYFVSFFGTRGAAQRGRRLQSRICFGSIIAIARAILQCNNKNHLDNFSGIHFKIPASVESGGKSGLEKTTAYQ